MDDSSTEGAAQSPSDRPSRSSRRWVIVALGGAGVAAVIGVAALRQSGGSDPTAAQTRSSPTPPPAVLTPLDVTASTSFSPFEIVLTWNQPSGGPDVNRFEVLREAELIADLVATSTTVTDYEVEPGETYRYSIVAISGERRSTPATIQVLLPVPPVSKARLEGNYTVSAKATSHSGYLTFRARPRFSWFVDPKCDDGPCDAVVEMTGVETLTFRLHRHGDRYTGSATGKLNVSCGQKPIASMIEIDVRVVKAAPHVYFGVPAKDWLAAELTGTLVQVESAQLGCDGSQAEYDITVTR